MHKEFSSTSNQNCGTLCAPRTNHSCFMKAQEKRISQESRLGALLAFCIHLKELTHRSSNFTTRKEMLKNGQPCHCAMKNWADNWSTFEPRRFKVKNFEES